MIPDSLTIITAAESLGWSVVIAIILAAVTFRIYKKKIVAYFASLKYDVSVIAGALIDPKNGQRIIRRHEVIESLARTEEALLIIREMLKSYIDKSCDPETCPFNDKLNEIRVDINGFREEAKNYRIASHDYFNKFLELMKDWQHEQAAYNRAVIEAKKD